MCGLIWRNLWSRRSHLVFLLGLALFATGLAGVADVVWPVMDGGGAVTVGGVVEFAIGCRLPAVPIAPNGIALQLNHPVRAPKR